MPIGNLMVELDIELILRAIRYGGLPKVEKILQEGWAEDTG